MAIHPFRKVQEGMISTTLYRCLKHELFGVQPFKHQGKERLELAGNYTHDHGARMAHNAIGRWTVMDPLMEKYYPVSPYVYCGNNPVSFVDPDGMDYYQSGDGSAVMWQEGSDESIDVEGEAYSNIGSSYNQDLGNGVTIHYNQNKASSIEFTAMGKDKFRSQFTKVGGEEKKADCNVTCNKMLAANDSKSDGSIAPIAKPTADGRAGAANSRADTEISKMSSAIEKGVATKVNIDHSSGTSSGDKMGDHFVVVVGKVETVSDGKVMDTKFKYFDPGTRSLGKGTSEKNVFNIVNSRLVGTHINKGTGIVVSSIRPTK